MEVLTDLVPCLFQVCESDVYAGIGSHILSLTVLYECDLADVLELQLFFFEDYHILCFVKQETTVFASPFSSSLLFE